MIRTADALGRQVWCSGFTPYPAKDPAVLKTSLGAEETVALRTYRNPTTALEQAEKENFLLVALEITSTSIALDTFAGRTLQKDIPLALICGNENTGVLAESLERCAYHVHIPMRGVKESLNVGQAAAIAMWELNKN